MSRAPKLSVVVPMYNKAPSIDRLITSVRAQSFVNFEVIIVDDGSTDSSFERASRATRDDSRFHLIQQANGGVSKARNTGVAASRAEWIAFLDADDEWRADFLASILDGLQRYPDVVLIGTAHDTVQEGQKSLNNLNVFGTEAYSYDFDLFGVWARAGECPVFIGASAVRRSTLHEVGGFQEGMNLGEELLTFVRLSERGKFLFVNRAQSIYHLSASGSLATSPSEKAVRNHMQLIEELERRSSTEKAVTDIRNVHRDIQVHHLMRLGMREDLWKFLWRSPTYWSAQVWLLAALELVRLRAPLRQLLKEK